MELPIGSSNWESRWEIRFARWPHAWRPVLISTVSTVEIARVTVELDPYCTTREFAAEQSISTEFEIKKGICMMDPSSSCRNQKTGHIPSCQELLRFFSADGSDCLISIYTRDHKWFPFSRWIEAGSSRPTALRSSFALSKGCWPFFHNFWYCSGRCSSRRADNGFSLLLLWSSAKGCALSQAQSTSSSAWWSSLHSVCQCS